MTDQDATTDPINVRAELRSHELAELRRQRDAALDLASLAIRWLSSPGTPLPTRDVRAWHGRLVALEQRARRDG